VKALPDLYFFNPRKGTNKMTTLTPEQVEAGKKFARFNSGPHHCVDVPDGNFTISCVNSEGKKVTFAFCPNTGPYDVLPGHFCVDIQHHHDGDKNEGGIPVQNVHVFGQGGTAFTTKRHLEGEPRDMDLPTLVSVDLRPTDETN
jgi:hypothetical protein